MALEVQNQNCMSKTSVTTAPAVGDASTSAKITIPIGQVDETSGVQTNNEVKTKRTADELYNSLANLCKAHGLNLAEARNIGLLSFVAGKTEEELLNVEQKEIDKIVQKISNAINAIKEDIDAIKNGEKELTFDLIKNYVRLLNGQVPTGWDSVESFRKAQKRGNAPESLAERLERMYGCDVEKLSKEQLAEKLEAYFDGYFNELVKSGKSREKIDNLQLTDFTKLLFNSTPEEYDMFRDAIEYLVANNRCKGYQAILDSFTTEVERTKFANETTYEQVKKWQTKPDQRREVPSEEANAEITATVLKDKDAKHIEEYQEDATNSAIDFYTEENKAKLEEIKKNPEIIKNIQEKLTRGEQLTEEEQNLFEIYVKDKHFRGDNKGQLIGISINEVIDKSDRKDLLNNANINIYEIGQKAGDDFYKDVLQALVDYITDKNNEETLAISKDELVQLLDEVSNGNYSKVASGATSAELNAPTIETNDNNSNNQETSLGFATTQEKPNTEKLDEYNTIIKNNSDKEDNTPRIARAHNTSSEITLTRTSNLKDYATKYGAFKGFATYAKEVGVVPALKEAFKNLQNTDKTQVKKAVERQNTNNQAKLIKDSGISSINNLLAWVREDAIKKMENKILRTTYVTKAVKEQNEKIDNKNN